MRSITVKLDEELVAKLDAYRIKFHQNYLSDALKLMILFCGSELPIPVGEHPIYAVPVPILLPKVKAKALTYHEKKAVNDAAKAEEYKKIATAPFPEGLNGTLSPDGKMVTYNTYFERGRDEVTILLREVNTDLINVQYQPSYDEIKRLQAEGKIDYELVDVII